MPINAKSICRVIPRVRSGRDYRSSGAGDGWEAMQTCPLGHSAARHTACGSCGTIDCGAVLLRCGLSESNTGYSAEVPCCLGKRRQIRGVKCIAPLVLNKKATPASESRQTGRLQFQLGIGQSIKGSSRNLAGNLKISMLPSPSP